MGASLLAVAKSIYYCCLDNVYPTIIVSLPYKSDERNWKLKSRFIRRDNFPQNIDLCHFAMSLCLLKF